MNTSVGTVETEYSFSMLLECAADNDVEGFKRSVFDESEVRQVGLWYVHHRVSKKGVLEHRTPLMVAAKYGSADVMKLILSLPEVDVNFSCGSDNSSALHCAASGGSSNAIDVIKLLLLAGADPSSTDANGHRPVDIIVAYPNFPNLKIALEKLLKNIGSLCQWELQFSTSSLNSSSPPISWTSEEGKKDCVDPSFPDTKDDAYANDKFWMFSFKIQPCSRAYFHDWTECPFAHPGENARRRDLRRFHYSCVPCPDHRKGVCRHGDFCEYSHGIFESWLHPAQYRTRLCRDGSSCSRRVCFFAHTNEQLRPVSASTGAAVPSLQAPARDFTAAFNLFSGALPAVSAVPPFPFTPPMSPSGNDLNLLMAWPQQNISNLEISGNNLQASRLRTTSNAREIPSEELNTIQYFELLQQHLLNDLSYISQPHRNSSTNLSACFKQLNPSNPDRLWSAEVSSPQSTYRLSVAHAFSPSYKSAVINKSQLSSPRMMSPHINESISTSSSHLSALLYHDKQESELGSLNSGELGFNLTYNLGSNGLNSWSKQDPVNGNVDWSVEADEVGRRQKSSNGQYGEEPDVSWIQSVLKDPSET
ncbi:hypothetical protein JCGZ_25924 [Jatropha curcas]|uniref:C3H1-type domain-containing protein n=2 Tax=Jatropha curcas TaxID=180498 RepID=A0A067JH09_JATCU|nr:hypothetical protein JCGZ_25924 [Jatropha curcas]